jgi:hypothetical protein
MALRALRTSLLFGLSLALAAFIGSCKKEDGRGASFAASAKIVGDLQVVHQSPLGATAAPHEAESVVVIFDQPMVPLEAVPEGKGSSFLRLEPSVPGKFRWKGTRALTFTPERRFPFGSTVKVTVPAGTTSLTGYTLNKDVSWTFETFRPSLLRHFPRDEQGGVRLDERILLVFNQAVDKRDAAKYVTLTEVTPEDRSRELDCSLERPPADVLEAEGVKDDPGRALLIVPRQRFKPEHGYVVAVKAGLRGEEGPLGTDEEAGFRFETFKTFKFVDIAPGDDMDPQEALRVQFTNEVAYKEFAEKARFEPQVAVPEYYREWDYGNDYLWLNVPLKPETAYTLRLPPGLSDVFGNALGEEIKVRFTTGSLRPALRMTTGHGLVESYGNRLYSFQSVNRESVGLKAAVLGRNDVIPILKMDRVFWSSENFQPRPGFYAVDRTLETKTPRNVRQHVPIDLKEILRGEQGIVFLQLDTGGEERWDRYPKACLQVTSLGLSAKFSPENNLVWVTDLRTGLPLPKVQVELRGDANQVLWKGETDAQGRAAAPGWKALGLKAEGTYEKPRQWIFASRGSDLAVLSSDWGTGLEPYEFGIDYDYSSEPEAYQGALFTERGIYRAGETVHVKGIVRRNVKGKWTIPAGSSVSCEIMDSIGSQVHKGTAALDAYGAFAFDYTSGAEGALGYYQITASLPPEGPGRDPYVFSESFRIEAYRPAEFEVLIRAQKPNFVFGEEYSADILANYLFGGAMAGQKVKWHLRLNPTEFTPPGHRGYVFGNQLEWWESDEEARSSRLVASADTLLDASGRIRVKAPLVAEKEKDAVLAVLEATVQSPSRRSVSSRIQTVVHRGEFSIGLKPDTTFLQSGERLGVSVVAVRPDGKRTSEKVALKLIRREWNSVRKSGVGGRFEWVSERVDKEVSRQSVRPGAEAAEAVVVPDKAGFYVLAAEAEDRRGNTVGTSTYVYVTGPDYVPWERDDRDIIELVADAEEYSPGDTAMVLVKSPYESAKALVTVERESVLEHMVVDIKGSMGRVAIPIKPDYLPNVFVSVLLVQGRKEVSRAENNEDIGKPSFKIGYVKLGVNPSQKRLNVEVAADKPKYKPRDKVTVRLKVRDAANKGVRASVSLAVVDIGVLNLIGYRTPDPFGRFYSQRPLAVQTAELRQYIVGQREFGEKGEDSGGGGEEGGAGGLPLSEVELRGDFRTTAYWNPSQETDDQGLATFSFDLPDNLTSFRVMAVALTKDSQFGSGETAFRVSKPLQVMSSLPRFARLGDTFRAGVVVHNFSDKDGEVTLGLEARGILLRDKSPTRRLSIPAGRSQEVLFALEADRPGQAVFAFRARMGDFSDGVELKLPVVLSRPKETVAVFSQTETSAEERVVIPEGAFLEESDFEVQASSSAMAGLKGCVDYLTDYPYLCLEQRVSSILPYLVAPKVIREFELSRLKPEEINNHVRSNLDALADYQADDGGFKLWPESRRSSPFLTAYAVFALIKARSAGHAIDVPSLNRAAQYLRDSLKDKDALRRHHYSAAAWGTSSAFALYDLALLKTPLPAYAEKLYTERKTLPLFGRAMLLKALHHGGGPTSARGAIIQEMLNAVKITPSQAHFEDEADRSLAWIYNSNLRTTAFILQALVEVESKHPLLPDIVRWILEKRKSGRWNSTQENFFVFYALNDYFARQERVTPDFKVKISLARKTLLEEAFRGWRAQPASARTPLAGFKTGRELPLKVDKSGAGLVYYGARMTYAPNSPQPARDEGLAVFKTLSTLDGKPLGDVKAGTVAVVTLEVVVPQESPFVVVHDPLPAGFEAVNVSLSTESEEERLQMEELEDADIPWWLERFNRVEMHDDRVLLFADTLGPGIHTYRYLVRALNYGEYLSPGARVEQMYAPEVFGRSPERLVKIIK